MENKLEPVIGLEIHIQLNTETKLFCKCKNEYGATPNTHICPVCLGYPGALPVLNEEAVRLALKVALALHADIHKLSRFYRKNYFYPDLPKGYQITQYTESLATGGYIEIETSKGYKRIRLERMNIEEEAAKSIHTDTGEVLLDYNRSGIPLLEMVTLPDMNSPEEARTFLEKLRLILRYLEVSECDMEKGELRVDANISLRKPGEKLGVKVELKNLNSFKSVYDGLNYEIERQKKILQGGGTVIQETRLWDEYKKETRTMRVKEEAHDYRYFPEPDLPPLVVRDTEIEELKKTLPELPDEKLKRFVSQYNIGKDQARILSLNKNLADYFERAAQVAEDKRLLANWINVEILGYLNENNLGIQEFRIHPEELGEFLNYVSRGKLSYNMAKDIFKKTLYNEESLKHLLEEALSSTISSQELEKIINKVLEENQELVEKFRNGKTGVLGALIGKVMKETRGRADARKVKEILESKIGSPKT